MSNFKNKIARAMASKNTTSLANIANQSYITEKAKTVDVNNALALKANQSDLDTTNNNVTTNTSNIAVHTANIATHASQIAGLSSGSPQAIVSLAVLQSTYPSGSFDSQNRPISYVATADGHRYYWNGTAWTDGGAFQGTVIGDKTVTRTKLGSDVFTPIIGSNTTINSVFLDIKLYGFDKTKIYSMALLRKNYNSSGKTQFIIYLCNSDGSLTTSTINIAVTDLTGIKTYYFDSNSTEITKPTFLTSNMSLSVTINLDLIADGTSITSQAYSSGGISPLCYDINNTVKQINIINTQINAINAQLQTSSQLTNMALPIIGSNNILSSAITDLVIFGATKADKYSIGLLRKNYSSSGQLQLTIYKCNSDGSLSSSSLVNFISTDLTGIKTYVIDKTSPYVNTDNTLGNLVFRFTVNLDLIPDATNLTSMVYSVGGISQLTYQYKPCNNQLFYKKPFKTQRTTGDYYKIGAWYTHNNLPAFNNLGSAMIFKVRNTTTCTVTFTADTRNSDPVHYPNYNYLAYSIDGGAFTSTNNMTINITGLSTNEHVITIILECINGSLYRYANGEGIMFNSIAVDSGGEYFAVKPMNRKILFFGDSITEGGSFDPSWTTKPNSWLSSWDKYLCDELNAVAYVKACMAMGCLRNDSPNITQLTNYINYTVDGQWFDLADTPDLIITNIGTNDSAFTDTAFQTELTNCVNKILNRYPGIPVFLVVPFNQTHANAFTNLIGVWSDVFIIQTAGWGITTGVGVHPIDTGAQKAGKLGADDIIKVMGCDYFNI